VKTLVTWLALVSRRDWLRLGVVALLFLLPWAFDRYHLEEQERSLVRQLASNERSLRDLRQRLDNLGEELRIIEENRGAFEELVASGFVGGIDRLAARRLLEAASDANRLLGITYQIGPEERRSERSLEGEGLRYVAAEISVEQQAFLDADLFRFERTLARDLPGVLVPLRLELRRARGLGDEALAAVARGDPVPLVTGRYLGRWEAIRPATPEERGER